LQEIFEAGEVDIDPDDDVLVPRSLVRSSGRSTAVIGSRSSRRTTCASEGCHHRIAQTPSPNRSRRAGRCKVNIEDHVGQSITGDLMAKAW
jgi:hypothetical protein